MKPRAIEVHVDELVLEGFAAGDRQLIAEAVQAELAQQLSAGDVPAAWLNPSSIRHLDAGSFDVPAHASPAAVGAGVARSILGRNER